jgi:hypothetical protein
MLGRVVAGLASTADVRLARSCLSYLNQFSEKSNQIFIYPSSTTRALTRLVNMFHRSLSLSLSCVVLSGDSEIIKVHDIFVKIRIAIETLDTVNDLSPRMCLHLGKYYASG